MALAILRLCGMVKEPIVAPSARGPPREAACNTGSQSHPIAQGDKVAIGPVLDVAHCPIFPVCEHAPMFTKPPAIHVWHQHWHGNRMAMAVSWHMHDKHAGWNIQHQKHLEKSSPLQELQLGTVGLLML